MTPYQTRLETDLLQYSVAMGAWVDVLSQASSSGVQVTSDPEADKTLACTSAPEEVETRTGGEGGASMLGVDANEVRDAATQRW